jgi:hypothetical protein
VTTINPLVAAAGICTRTVLSLHAFAIGTRGKLMLFVGVHGVEVHNWIVLVPYVAYQSFACLGVHCWVDEFACAVMAIVKRINRNLFMFVSVTQSKHYLKLKEGLFPHRLPQYGLARKGDLGRR